jgi:hypothetical protein
MHLKPGFTFVPLESAAAGQTPPPVDPVPPYGYLSLLPGHWAGTGFNMITRPYFDPDNSGQNHFLELNLTNETFDFAYIEGAIPNRGRLQGDIDMFGLTYLQQVSDANLSTPTQIVGLHAEPGVWANVPATTAPPEPPTVVRMASIPHGTAIIAQGTAVEVPGLPDFGEPAAPYPNAFNSHTQSVFIIPEAQDISQPSPFRSSGQQVAGITQAMLDTPVQALLKSVTAQQTILSTVIIAVSTEPGDPTDPTVTCGGGTANTAFLAGAADGSPNARAAKVDSTFWIEHVQGQGEPDFLQLQYRQTVFLEFDGFFWPHVSVATLRQAASGSANAARDAQIAAAARAGLR